MSASLPIDAQARHELIPVTAPERWRAALSDLPHGHAHTHGFCRAVKLSSGLPTFLYRYEHDAARVVCALSERRFRGHTDIVTPYGFGGFATERIPADFPCHWTDFARSRGWVCGYHALDPSLCEPTSFPTQEVHVHNRLYVMDLRGPIEDVQARLSKNRRRQLRQWPSAAQELIHDRGPLTEFLVDSFQDFFARRGAGPATNWFLRPCVR